MKGQIFIITSVLILLALLLTSITIKTSNIRKDEVFYESFSNLENELIRTVDIALINKESAYFRLNDFIDFSTNFLKKKGYTENVAYSISSIGLNTVVYLNISLSSSNSYLLENLIINRTVYT